MARAWFAAVALAVILVLGLPPRVALAHDDARLLELLPAEVRGVLAIEDAAGLRTSELGQVIAGWISEHDALPQTRRAWSLFARRLGVSEAEAFDGLLGGSAVIAVGQRDGSSTLDWMLLAAVDHAMDVRMIRRTRAVPRKLVHGRALLGLEEESFLLTTLPPLPDGRSVLVLAPADAQWLLVRTLAVSAGKAPALAGDLMGDAPPGATVRGFFRPAGERLPGRPRDSANDLWQDIQRLLWSDAELAQSVTVWALTRGRRVEVGLSTDPGGVMPFDEPSAAADSVLLDIVGPASTIYRTVLQPAGLGGLVPEDLTVSAATGELVVRQGPEGIDLGARLPLAPSAANGPGADVRQRATPGAGRAHVVSIRALAETRGSRAIFGPHPQMAWTLLGEQTQRPELVLAVTAGPDVGQAHEPERSSDRPARPSTPLDGSQATGPQAQAVCIVLEAADRQGPPEAMLRGTARPHALWRLLQARSTGEGSKPGKALAGQTSEAGGEVTSLAALIDAVRWTVETDRGRVQGRIVLELREARPR